MTRINLVNVQSLADQHLFAEWREIKMVPPALRRSLKTKNTKDIIRNISKRYTLNTGHVTFFFDKMKFLTDRYNLLTEELLKRNYNLSSIPSFEELIQDIPSEFKSRDWSPDKEEIQINVERILTRIGEKPNWYRFYGSKVSLEYFESTYNE